MLERRGLVGQGVRIHDGYACVGRHVAFAIAWPPLIETAGGIASAVSPSSTGVLLITAAAS